MIMEEEIQKDPYWMLHFIVKHGDWIAIVAAVLPLLAGIACAIGWGALWCVAAGAVGTAFMFLLMRSFVELVRVIVDMLLPK
jgi:uncharacterized membrane protein YphA (DoxX/SURF4 family)